MAKENVGKFIYFRLCHVLQFWNSISLYKVLEIKIKMAIIRFTSSRTIDRDGTANILYLHSSFWMLNTMLAGNRTQYISSGALFLQQGIPFCPSNTLLGKCFQANKFKSETSMLLSLLLETIDHVVSVRYSSAFLEV